MDIGNESILDTYLFETNTLLQRLDELLLQAEQAGELSEEDVNEIFRAMHTIKGSSAMLEFNSLMEISHHIEDLFFYIRENGMDTLTDDQKSELFNLMFSSTDKLREEVQKVEDHLPLDTNIDEFISQINALLSKINGSTSDEKSNNDPGSDNSTTIGTVPLTEPTIVKVTFDSDCGMENLRAFMLITALKEIDLNFNWHPKDVDTNSDTTESIVMNGFYLGFNSIEDAKAAEPILSESGTVQAYEIIDNQKSQPEPEQQTESSEIQTLETEQPQNQPQNTKKNCSAGGTPNNNQSSSKQSLISVNLSKLDSLMAIVGEIVITESMVTSSPELQNVKLDSFLKSARQLRKLTDDLQDIAMSLRMVSISSVFQKMHRIVRDMSKNLNKDTRLKIIGENTEVDKTIVDSIADPIMHIVRNSMDHGIENSVEERIALGKDPQGEIVLQAEHTGSEVIISVTDDGYGMDPKAILAKAERNGLLTKPIEEYSKKEALAFLMMPGFSTNTEVTEYSGRGVGMDVVKKNIENIGGTVSITSEVGYGSCVTLKIPLTLAIVDGMEISIGSSIFTIPIANIRQSFKAYDKDIILDAAGNEMIKCIDGFYPIVRVSQLFDIGSNAQSLEEGILIWVEAADKSYCMFVDKLIGEQQVVVKPLPSYLSNFNIKETGISGCTILGDGNISLILDVANIYNGSKNIIF